MNLRPGDQPRELVRLGDHRRRHIARARIPEPVHEQILSDGDHDIVEHHRDDEFIRAPFRPEEAREHAAERAQRRRRQNREHGRPDPLERTIDRDQSGQKTAYIEGSVRDQAELLRLKHHAGGESREQDRDRGLQHVAEPAQCGERTRHEGKDRLQRFFAHTRDDDKGDPDGDQNREHRPRELKEVFIPPVLLVAASLFCLHASAILFLISSGS